MKKKYLKETARLPAPGMLLALVHSQSRKKKDCPRVKEYIHAIYDLAIPEDSGMTAKEFLDDERLSYLTWKNIVMLRFDDISYETFKNVIKIIGEVNLENLQEEIDIASKDWDIDKILKEHFRTPYKNGK